MKKHSIGIKFGEKLRAARLKRGLSQEKLAELANVNRNYIGMLERAERDPSLSYIEKIANGLKMRIRDLLDV